MQVFELTFSKGDSIDAVSLVEMPAIEEDAIFLKTQKTQIKLSLDADKQEIIGAALVPDKPIFRKGDAEDYYIYFSKDTVKAAMTDFMQPTKKNNFTLEHEVPTSEVVAMESWIVTGEDDKANTLYNLDAPEGSWILRTHVPNTEYWNNVIKAGNFSGYSIEAKFGNKIARQELSDDVLEFLMDSIAETVLEYQENKDSSLELSKSFGGYPQAAKSAAKSAIEANARNNNKCATNVGKIRARQIVRGEKFTLSTVKRIYSYLSRAGEYYDGSDQNACGTISYKLWGGKSMLSWSRKILRQEGQLKD
jgi:hypothetical protein